MFLERYAKGDCNPCDSFQTSSFNVKTQSDCALVSRLLVLFFGDLEIMQSLIFLFGNRKTKMSSSEEGHPITSESDILQRVKTRRTRILIGVLAAVLVVAAVGICAAAFSRESSGSKPTLLARNVNDVTLESMV